MDAVGGVGRAGSAGDEAHPRPPGEPPLGQRHHRRARLLPADGDRDRSVVQRVERGKVGFARHAIDALDPLGDELIDEDLPPGAHEPGMLHETLLRREWERAPVWQEGAGGASGARRRRDVRGVDFLLWFAFKGLRDGFLS